MGKYLGAVLSLVVGAAIVFGAVTALGVFAHPLPADHGLVVAQPSTDQNVTKQVHLTLMTFPFNPYEDQDWIAKHVTQQQTTDEGFPYPQPGDNQDWVTYWPTTTLVVPAHALVTIDIQNYDSATPLLNPFYGRPQGVVGNAITVDGSPVTSVDPANVSHTFTIHSIPNASQPWLYVSVPLTGVASDAPADDAGMPNQPVVTEFSFITAGPGQYIWQCFDPCGSTYNGFGGPMATKGYMSGTITVQ
jgi:hypothetical protein